MDQDSDVEELVESAETLISSILGRTPTAALHRLVNDGAPLWYQNEEGLTALHAAAFVEDEELVRFLIERGAVWNAVDNLGNTAGDVALSLNSAECYRLIRDAGIRSEYLLHLLSSRADLESSSSSVILRAQDATAAGSADAFLSSRLRFTTDAQGQDVCLVTSGDEEVGVMMGWERGIMQETVNKLCLDHEELHNGLNILNIGFGLGIIDSMFQALPTPPSQHVIIEPHPDVLQHMRELGWYEKQGVTILEGKWQDFVDSEAVLGVGGFDVVYTDTFSEKYEDLHKFFEHIPDLLAGPESRFGFFNGLGATNALFYDVYTHLSELHLSEVGINVQWSDVDVAAGDGLKRWGETRKYFNLRLYRLPVCTMASV